MLGTAFRTKEETIRHTKLLDKLFGNIRHATMKLGSSNHLDTIFGWLVAISSYQEGSLGVFHAEAWRSNLDTLLFGWLEISSYQDGKLCRSRQDAALRRGEETIFGWLYEISCSYQENSCNVLVALTRIILDYG